MDLSQVAPPLRAAVRRMPHFPLGNRWTRALLRGLIRLVPTKRLRGVTLEVRRATPTLPGLRIYRPQTTRSNAALLWIHGGGYILGRAVQDDRFCNDICLRLGFLVVSVDYRLAPEHPFPAPLDDCLAAWKWMQRASATLNLDPQHIAVGGESAGGGLAAALVQRIHDRKGPHAAAQWLFCPMLDDRTAADRSLDAEDHLVWNNQQNAIGWRSYLAQEPGLAQAPPYAVPSRRADLTGLPPTWIGAGDIELFFAEDRDYADRLRQAGVDVVFEVVGGAPHALESWAADTEMAKTYVAGAQHWLAKALAVD